MRVVDSEVTEVASGGDGELWCSSGSMLHRRKEREMRHGLMRGKRGCATVLNKE
jgi:hypothetical protein